MGSYSMNAKKLAIAILTRLGILACVLGLVFVILHYSKSKGSDQSPTPPQPNINQPEENKELKKFPKQVIEQVNQYDYSLFDENPAEKHISKEFTQIEQKGGAGKAELLVQAFNKCQD